MALANQWPKAIRTPVFPRLISERKVRGFDSFCCEKIYFFRAERVIDHKIDWNTDWLPGWPTHWLTDKLTDWDRWTDGQTDRLTDWLTNWLIDRSIDFSQQNVVYLGCLRFYLHLKWLLSLPLAPWFSSMISLSRLRELECGIAYLNTCQTKTKKTDLQLHNFSKGSNGITQMAILLPCQIAN